MNCVFYFLMRRRVPWDEFASVRAECRREFIDLYRRCYHLEVYKIVNSIGHTSFVYRNSLDEFYDWYSIKSAGRVRHFNILRCDRLDIIRRNIIADSMHDLRLCVQDVVPAELFTLIQQYALA